MKFSLFTQYLEELTKTSSRNKITLILADLFKKADREEIARMTYLLSGNLAPSYEAVNFNLADRLILVVIAKAFGINSDRVKETYKKLGDLGSVTEEFAIKTRLKKSDPEVLEVYEDMYSVAREAGLGSQERKISLMAELLGKLEPKSGRFVVRILLGKLRLGFSNMTMLDALSWMVSGSKGARGEIENAFNVTADIGKIAERVKEKGLAGLKDISAVPGTPIRASLAERLPSAEKIIEKVGPEVAIEPKYDGFRSQVHVYGKARKEVRIFSRNLENITNMFPDIVEKVLKLPVESAIFDGEAIGINPETQKFVSFQETVQRKRKYEIEMAVKKLPLKLFLFDILYKDGKTLLDLPFSERRKILMETVKGYENSVEITRQNLVSDPQEIKRLMNIYLVEGLEGLMAKKIDAKYKAGGRGFHWVKYKKTTEGGLVDTIDAIIMGTYFGKGRRVGFGTGAFLVGVRDGNKIKTICKIGTGLTDIQWRKIEERTKKLRTLEKPPHYDVDKNLEPDFWVKPEIVVEIMADEITRSPVHTVCQKEGKGLALRFPRLVKIREDKKAEDATTAQEVNKLYLIQKS